MSLRTRRKNLMVRLVGAMLLIPGLLQVPLPQADFHIIRHRHGAGEVCSHHDHLLRWHPQAGEGEAVAVLHWHWLLPGSLDESAVDHEGRNIPALHAHDGESPQLERTPSPVIVREDRDGGRFDVESALGLHFGQVAWLEPEPTPPPRLGAHPPGVVDHAGSATALPRLVRWNC